MESRTFYTQLGLVSVAATLIVVALHQAPGIAPHQLLSWISLAAFIGISVLMYYTAQRAVVSARKSDFLNVVTGFTMGKMVLSFMIVLGYVKLAEPTNKLFVLPFFAVYAVYTVFEVYFMMKISRLNS